MHIIFLNPQGNFDQNDTGWTQHPDFGGQLVYVKEVALALARRGHKVDILTRQIVADHFWVQFTDRFDQYRGAGNLRVIRLPCGPDHFLPKEDLWPYLAEWADHICHFYQQEQKLPDIATGHYGDGGLAAVLLQEKLGIPFTFTGHSLGAQKMDKLLQSGSEWGLLIDRFRFDKRIAAERVAMARAGRIIVSTSQERDEQYAHNAYQKAVDHRNHNKFSIVPPGVNLSVFGNEVKNEFETMVAHKIESMIARDIAPERRHLPIVLCSSRLERKKNHIALVKAFAQDKQLRQAANLAIILRGSSNPLKERSMVYHGESLEILNEIAQELDAHHLWECITAFDLNSQSELAAGYRHLAKHHRGVFCLTALYEPFGLAPLEAMAAGLVAVVTKNGGPSESLRDQQGEYGILVDPDIPQDIARGLMRVIADETTWQRFQIAGARRVNSAYTWHQTSERYLSIFESLIAKDDQSDKSHALPLWSRKEHGDAVDAAWLQRLYEDNRLLEIKTRRQ